VKLNAQALAWVIGSAVLAMPLRGAPGEDIDPHAHHRHVVEMDGIQRKVVDYRVPDVRLVRADGAAVSLRGELDDGRVVVLSFIYTSCTTVCPLTSQSLARLQQDLGRDRARVHLMSISIDPEFDTPVRLKAYAERFGAEAGWQHYTGSLEASVAAQRAFDVYRGNKMNHDPATFLRAAPGKPWVRLDGFADPGVLLEEVSRLVASL
jgi:protein SCO1/2